jgi:probable F420-dependent oxidoreductase
MRVGVVVPMAEGDAGPGVPPYADIRAFAQQAEAGGLDSVWVFDHLLFRAPGQPTAGIHEAWTLLSALAEATRRVALGQLVLAVPFRNPALLAKQAATLDAISGGRLVLGLGAGWHEPEFRAFGYPFDHRGSRFEEALAIIVPLIREGHVDFHGRFHEAADGELLPPARPDLPILVAARGPRLLRLTGRHADSWNTAWFGLPDERLATRLGELEAACREVGRDPATLMITTGVTVRFVDLLPAGATPGQTPALEGDAEAIAAGLRAHAALGVGEVICALEPATPPALERLARAVALLRGG